MKPDEQGTLVWLKDPDVEVIGTAETLTGIALATADGPGKWEHRGSTEVDWNGQTTKTLLGQTVFVLDGGDEVLEQEVGVKLDDETVVPLIAEKDRKPLLRMCCSTCGGENVGREGTARWDVETQQWVLGSIYDDGFCDDCGDDRQLEEREVDDEAD